MQAVIDLTHPPIAAHDAHDQTHGLLANLRTFLKHRKTGKIAPLPATATQEQAYDDEDYDSDDDYSPPPMKFGAPTRSPRSMTIHVKINLLRGKTISLKVRPTDSIKEVKDMIQKSEGIQPDHQRLTYGPHKLLDANTLSDYFISDMDTLFLN
tara:strand:+ start:557 stop:1015 length:459 start_codon:yes stop_codon:yes gene_type:complete